VNERWNLLSKIVRELAGEWTADGRMHVPPDDTSGDDDGAFWDEVDRRVTERLVGSSGTAVCGKVERP